MASKMLKRYGLERVAKILIGLGLLFNLFSWVAGFYYFGITNSISLFIIPPIFTLILIVLILVIRYRYTLFEKYPYLMNLPSLFYRIGQQKNSNNQSVAFSMIFTVHSLIVAFLGLVSLFLTIEIGSSILTAHAASSFLYLYFAFLAIMFLSVILQYRRIYIRLAK